MFLVILCGFGLLMSASKYSMSIVSALHGLLVVWHLSASPCGYCLTFK